MSSRLRCPKCNSTKVKKVEDKSRPIGYLLHAPQYKKVNVCKECSHKWE